MHDFHLADIIYKTILDYAQKNNLKKISGATIELGSIIEHGEAIVPANLKFNIKMLAEGGPAAGLDIEVLPSQGADWMLKDIIGE